MDAAYALYRMEGNRFLRECLGIVFRPSEQEITKDSLQSPFVLVVLKTLQDLSPIRTSADLAAYELFDTERPILLRIGSECLLGMFGDSHCNCESERTASLREIDRVGQGIYVHLPQEAQGQGLFYKAQELHLQVSGITPSGQDLGRMSIAQASRHLLGPDATLDRRDYTSLAHLFLELGLRRYRYNLLTESPAKATFVQRVLGVSIDSLQTTKGLITIENAGEYLAKLYKDYTLTDPELEEIYQAIFRAPDVPIRVLELLSQMKQDLSDGMAFQANLELLRKIATIAEARGLKYEAVDVGLLKDAESYDEYQVEMQVTDQDVRALLDARVFGGLESLRYEENHFFDLVYLKHVPTRYMKVRYAYRLSDRNKPIECKFIYKIPIGENTYKIKSVLARNDEQTRLLVGALADRERHLQPVFTHNVISPDPAVTALVKRYNRSLRTLSLMGPEVRVRDLIASISQHITVSIIDDPSNYRYVQRSLSLDFTYDELQSEELDLFRSYCMG